MVAQRMEEAPEQEPSPQELAQAALAEYTKAKKAIVQFTEKYGPVMDQYSRLVKKADEAETSLKDQVRHMDIPKEGLTDGSFIVTVTHPIKKWFNAQKIIDNWPQVVDMPGVMEVNKKMVEQLAKSGQIPKDIVKFAEMEEEGTPAVYIKVNTAPAPKQEQAYAISPEDFGGIDGEAYAIMDNLTHPKSKDA